MTREPFFRPFLPPRCGARFSAAVHERQREAAVRIVTWQELKPGDLVETLDEETQPYGYDAHVFGVVTEIDHENYVWAIWEQNEYDALSAFVDSTGEEL